MKRDVIHVDWSGRDKNGNTYDMVATPDAIASGVMKNAKATLVYPDGGERKVKYGRVTAKGMAKLAKFKAEGGL